MSVLHLGRLIALWTLADWQFAADTAVVHSRFLEGYSWAAAGELRQREKILGTTLDARQALRIKYVSPAEHAKQAPERPTPTSVHSLDERRARLAGEH